MATRKQMAAVVELMKQGWRVRHQNIETIGGPIHMERGDKLVHVTSDGSTVEPEGTEK